MRKRRIISRGPRHVRPAGSVIAAGRRRFVERLCHWAGFSLAGAPPELCELAFEAGRLFLQAQIAGALQGDQRVVFLTILAALIRDRLAMLQSELAQ